jgi:IS5 family transposase
MQPKKSDRQLSFLCPDLLDQLDPRNHLLGLAKVIPWQVFEDNLRLLYAASGRPGKRVRLMVGLLILKQLEDGSVGVRPSSQSSATSKTTTGCCAIISKARSVTA